MDQEPPFQLVDTQTACAKAQALFERVYEALSCDLPPGADIRHIGATAVPGCLTKGDLDIVVRVPEQAFRETDKLLSTRFQRNNGSIRTDSFAAYEDASSDPHLGIQLTAIGGPHDFFHMFVEELSRSPELVREYNDLKRSFDGKGMAPYREAKDAFIERVLACRL